MRFIKKHLPGLSAAVISLSLFFASCGYHMGSMMHPQIHSIAFSEVRNDTKEPLVSEFVRSQIAACFQTDNSLKITSKEKADCILYCRVTNVTQSASRTTPSVEDDAFNPAEFSVSVSVEFEVLIPGRSEPLIPKRSVSGSAKYQYIFDPAAGRTSGLRQACYELGRQVVEYTVEGW